MKRIGLILYRKENKEEFNKIFDNIVEKYYEKKAIKKDTIIWNREIKGWVIVQIYGKSFRNYNYFDDFLFYFASTTKDNPNILVIGHNDEQGFMWTDYN